MDKAKFEEKFREYLERNRYTQALLAKELGFSRSTINKWITGENRTPIDMLYKICKLLDLSEEEREEFYDLAGYEDYLTMGIAAIGTGQKLTKEQIQKLRKEYFKKFSQKTNLLDLKFIKTPLKAPIFGIKLSDVFVPLQVEVTNNKLRQKNKPAAELLGVAGKPLSERKWYDIRRELESYRSQMGMEEPRRQRLNIPEILEFKRFVVLGKVGAGKSSLLRYITYALMIGDFEHIGEIVKGKIPIYVEITHYSNKLEDHPDLSLTDYICEHYFPDMPKFGQLFKAELQNQNCLVLLDGLDEVKDEIRIKRVVDKIEKHLTPDDQNHYVVTSRPTAYWDAPLTEGPEGFQQGTICDLDDQGIKQLTTAFYRKCYEYDLETGQKYIDNFLQALQVRPNVKKLAINPLHLTAMLKMYYEDFDLPSHRFFVYKYLTETLIGWAKSKPFFQDKRQDLQLKGQHILELLKPIAFDLIDSSVENIAPEGWILERLEDFYTKYMGDSPPQARVKSSEMLGLLCERYAILEEYEIVKNRSIYSFLHQIYPEYLAALRLYDEWREAKNRNEQILHDKYLHRDRWKEVIKLMVAHASTHSPYASSDVLDEILIEDEFESVLHRNLLFAGECLGDDISVPPTWAKENIIVKLCKLLNSDAIPLRENAANVLTGLKGTDYEELTADLLDNIIQNEKAVEVKRLVAEILISFDKYDIVRPTLQQFIDRPAGYYSLWALAKVLENEHEPQEKKIDLLKKLIQKDEFQLGLYLLTEPKVQDIWCRYIDDRSGYRIWDVFGEYDLKELATFAKNNAPTLVLKENAEWILYQLSCNQSLKLVKHLSRKSKSWLIRCQAAKELYQRGKEPEVAIQTLRDVAEMYNKDNGVIVHVSEILVELGNRDLALQFLQNTAWDFNSKFRIDAVEQLAKFHAAELAIPLGLELYFGNKNEKNEVQLEQNQWRVVKALAPIAPPALITELWLDIAHQREHSYRYEAALALWEANRDKAIAILKNILNDEKTINHIFAVWELIHQGKELETLAENLNKLNQSLYSPEAKYWLTYAQARLKILLESNGVPGNSNSKPATNTFSKNTWTRQHLFQTVIVVLKKLIEENQSNTAARIAKARILKLQTPKKQVVSELTQTIADTQNDWVQLYATTIYKEWDEEDLALETTNCVLKSTKNPYLCINAAKILADLGHKTEAISALEQAKALEPEDSTLLVDISYLFYKFGDSQKATDVQNKAIDHSDNEKEWFDWIAIAKSYNEWGATNEALRILDHAITQAQTQTEPLTLKAEVLINIGQQKKAQKVLQKARDLDSKDPYNWIIIARLLHQCDNKNKAVEALNKATALAPEWIDIWVRKAQTLVNFQRYKDAQRASHNAIKLNPQYADAWACLGDAFYEGKNYEKAMDIYRKAKEIAPDHAYPWVGIGDTHFQQGDYNEAEKAFRKATFLAPNYVYAWQRLADTHSRQGNLQEAINIYDKMPDLVKQSSEYWFNLSLLHRNLGQYQQALKAITKAKKLNQDNPYYVYFVEGICHYYQGDHSQAEGLFHEALRHCKNNVDRALVWSHLGDLYYFMNDQENSYKAYKEATELDPKGIKISVGVCCMFLERWTEARMALDKECEAAAPNEYPPFVNLGIVNYKQGRIPEAKKEFKKALTHCVVTQDIHSQISRAWLLVVTEQTLVRLNELQTTLNQIPLARGLLSEFKRDTEFLTAIEEPQPVLSEMYRLLIGIIDSL